MNKQVDTFLSFSQSGEDEVSRDGSNWQWNIVSGGTFYT